MLAVLLLALAAGTAQAREEGGTPPTLDDRLGQLRSDEPSKRVDAALLLGEMRSEAAAIVPALVETSRDDPDADVRWAAVHSLGELRSEAAAVLPALAEALRDDPDADVRWVAADVLGKMRTEAAAVVPALTEALRDDPDAHVRWVAVRVLGEMRTEVAAVLPALVGALQKDADARVRRSAAMAIGELATPPWDWHPEDESDRAEAPKLSDATKRQAVAGLAGGIDDDDAGVRMAVLRGLAEYGPAARPAAERIAADLDGWPDHLRIAALTLLVAAELPDALTRRAILRAVRDGVAGDRWRNPLRVWREHISRGTAPDDELLGALRGGDDAQRLAAASGLASRGLHADRVREVLVELVGHADPALRYLAVEALGRLGRETVAAGDALIQVMRADDRTDVRVAAVRALRAMGPGDDAVVEALIATARRREAPDELRLAALDALGPVARQVGAAGFADRPDRPVVELAPATVRHVAETLANAVAWDIGPERPSRFDDRFAEHARGSDVVSTAARSLRWLGPRMSLALPALAEHLEAGEPHAAPAMAALMVMGEQAAPHLAEVIALTGAPDAGVRRTAVATVGRIGTGRPQEAVPPLAEALRADDAELRWAAVEALERFGPDAGAALEQLEAIWPPATDRQRHQLAGMLGTLGSDAEAPLRYLADQLGADPSRRRTTLAAWGERAIPHLRHALASDDASRRREALFLVGRLERDLALAFTDSIFEAALDDDAQVALQAIHGIMVIRRHRPEPDRAVPLLVGLLQHEAADIVRAAAAALGGYGEAAGAAAEPLVAAIEAHPSATWGILGALRAIGELDRSAALLAELNLDEPVDARAVFTALLDHPEHAARFIRRHPEVVAELAFVFPGSEGGEALQRVLTGQRAAEQPLRRWLLEQPSLPTWMIAWTGEPRWLPELHERIERTEPADEHHRTYLRAALRACGGEPEAIVSIGPDGEHDFRPRSAWPGHDPRRGRPGTHGDGTTPVLVTGRLRMPDGAAPAEPRFVRLNDSMLMGERREYELPVRYDPDTGRFACFTGVFAAYSAGGGGGEDGPYQTGSALVRIEADEVEPLTVRFFDEMPHVHVTLGPRRPSRP